MNKKRSGSIHLNYFVESSFHTNMEPSLQNTLVLSRGQNYGHGGGQWMEQSAWDQVVLGLTPANAILFHESLQFVC